MPDQDGGGIPRSVRRSRREAPLALLALLIGGLALFAPGLRSGYFGDDLMFVHDSHAHGIVPYFTDGRALSVWYRPIEAMILAAVQSRVGWDTFPVHVVALAAHVLECWIVWLAVRRLGGSARASVLAAIAMLVSQANAMAVLSTDTLSQLLSTLFGSACLLLLSPRAADLRSPAVAPLRSWIAALGAWACFTLALFSKESSVALLPLVAVVAWLSPGPPAFSGRVGRVVRLMLPLVLTFAVFMLLRRMANGPAPAFGEQRYNLRLGPNVLANLALVLGSACLAGSSVSVYGALAAHGIRGLLASPTDPATLTVVAIAAGTVLVLGLLGVGLVRSKQRALLLTLLACSVLAVAPMLLLNHVGELYTYAAMPFIAVVFGWVIAEWWERLPAPPARAALAIGLAALLVSHVLAVRQKLELLRVNGGRAAVLLAEVGPFVAQVAPGGTLLLVEPRGTAGGYSIYRTSGFHPIEYGRYWLREHYHRPDIYVRVIAESELTANPGWLVGAVALTLRDGHVVPMAPQGSPESPESPTR